MKDNELFTRDGLFRIPMQFFAEGDDAGNAGNGSEGGDAGQGNNPDGNANNGNNPNMVDIEKQIQSRIDKALAAERKKSADLQKTVDKLNKEKMTADELKAHELAEKEKEIAEMMRVATEKENRFTAIKALNEAGFEDVGGSILELVDFVMGENEEAIKNKVTAFKGLVDKCVAAEVEKTFKKHGRNPNGGGNNAPEGNDNDNSVAKKLGAAEAAKAKQSADIMKLYLGGNS